MKFDPDVYSITVRKENVDGEILYVGRVAEFPNISAYENSYEEALFIVRDAINTVKVIADDRGESMPAPVTIEYGEYSGRVTLRLPKSLHAQVDKLAKEEGISLNLYLATAVANHAGQMAGTVAATKAMNTALCNIMHHSFWLAGNAFQGGGMSAAGSAQGMQLISTGKEWFTGSRSN